MTDGRKALFFDVDGTLFSAESQSVPESAKRAVAAAREKGHLAFINSGRTYGLVAPIKDVIEMDGYCCGCGTRVIAGREALVSSTIPRELGLQIKKDILRHNLDGVLEGTDCCYFKKGGTRFARLGRIRESIRRTGHEAPYSWEDSCYDFDKFCIFADEQSDLAGFFETLGSSFNFINLGEGCYECVPAGYSKATAIDVILKKYDLAVENVYVFGDSMNDLSMFEYAKNCILMGHHDAGLEPYATFLTRNVEEDGIKYAMESLKLI